MRGGLGSDKSRAVIPPPKMSGMVEHISVSLKKKVVNKRSNMRFCINKGFYLHRYLLKKEYMFHTSVQEFTDVLESS